MKIACQDYNWPPTIPDCYATAIHQIQKTDCCIDNDATVSNLYVIPDRHDENGNWDSNKCVEKKHDQSRQESLGAGKVWSMLRWVSMWRLGSILKVKLAGHLHPKDHGLVCLCATYVAKNLAAKGVKFLPLFPSHHLSIFPSSTKHTSSLQLKYTELCLSLPSHEPYSSGSCNTIISVICMPWEPIEPTIVTHVHAICLTRQWIPEPTGNVSRKKKHETKIADLSWTALSTQL